MPCGLIFKADSRAGRWLVVFRHRGAAWAPDDFPPVMPYASAWNPAIASDPMGIL